MAKRFPIHVVTMGHTGAGKDTFAATFPKPILIWFFDAFGKDTPYLTEQVITPQGEVQWKAAKKVGEMQTYPLGKVVVPYRDIEREDGFVRIEYYHDFEPMNPNAYALYLTRMGMFHHEQDNWQTVVLSSVTMMEICARKYHQYALNPSTKDPRQWWGGSTDMLEEMLMMRFAGLKMNVVVLAHIDTERDELFGETVKNPAGPGRLRGALATQYAEHYHQFVRRMEDGKLAYLLQSQNDGRFASQTHIQVPSPSYPHFASLWTAWDKL